MAISPWFVNQLAPAWTISLVPDSGVVSVAGLVASNFSLTIRNNVTGVETTGAGSFSAITAAVTSTVNGQLLITSHASVQYQPAAADVATIGSYTLFLNVTYSNGLEVFNLGSFQVVPR